MQDFVHQPYHYFSETPLKLPSADDPGTSTLKRALNTGYPCLIGLLYKFRVLGFRV